jgi:hypothetical protein
MAQTGFTPIITYHSTTGAAVPDAANLAPGEMALNIADMKLYAENSSGVVTLLASSSGASGDVVGPASATDNAITRFDGTTGKLVQNSVVTIADSTGDISGVGTLNATTADLTNLEVTNIKAKDGTAAIAIADSTGVTTQSTPAIISVNSASDALRITQVGAGNALVVEDSANPDVSPFVIDTSGNTIIGNTASVSNFGLLQIHGTGSFVLGSATYQNNANANVFQLAKSRGTSAATYDIVQNNDELGSVRFVGADGTAFIRAAQITAAVDGTPGTNDMPGRLTFSTTADGGSSPTEAMRITNARNVLVGGTAVRGTTVGTAHIDLFNGTAPAGTLTNGISLYSSSGDFNFMDAAGNGYKVGFRNVPPVGTKTGSYTLAVGDVGKYVQVGSGGSITIPDATFAEGDVVSIFNNTSGDITVTCTITTAYIAGTDSDVASVTLATRGVATILFISGTVCVISGNVS